MATHEKDAPEEKQLQPLDEEDINLLKAYVWL
jgi:hypothetical protein